MFTRMLVVVLALGGALVTGACGKARSDAEPTTVSARIAAADGGTVQLGSAEIDIPDHVLLQDAIVSIGRHERSVDLHRSSGMVDAYAFDTHGVGLRGEVRLRLPAKGGVVAGGVPALAYENLDHTWNVMPAAASDGRMTAPVPHLSTWFGIDLGEWLSSTPDLLTRFAQLFKLRARPPQCDQGSSAGRATVTYPASTRLSQPPLLICLAAAGNDELAMHVVNNRTYAIALQPSGFGVLSNSGLQAASSTAQLARLYSRNGDVVVAPGDEAVLTIAANQTTASFTYRPQPFATLAMVDAGMLEGLVDQQVPSESLLGLANCSRDMATSASQAQALDTATRCASSVLLKWLGGKTLLLGKIFRIPVEVVATALAYVAASIKLATPVLDAWADLTLFRATTDVVSVARAVSAARPTPTHVPAPQATANAPGAPAPNPPAPPPVSTTRVVHYDCANDNSNIGKYVPSGHYWQNAFSAAGSQITSGWVLIGAASGGNHEARVGIYASPGMGSPLVTTTVQVSGYDGEAFTLPAPLSVTPGQQLYLTVVGIGDFTAYDNRSGCFIGRVEGTR